MRVNVLAMASTSYISAELWGRIREDYETTDISLNRLSENYEIKSATTIRRKVRSKAWARYFDAIAPI